MGRQTGIANLIKERAITDLERFRGAATIPVMGLQDLENDFFLKAVYGLAGDLLEMAPGLPWEFQSRSCWEPAQPDQC